MEKITLETCIDITINFMIIAYIFIGISLAELNLNMLFLIWGVLLGIILGTSKFTIYRKRRKNDLEM